jgi:hypothetical protein
LVESFSGGEFLKEGWERERVGERERFETKAEKEAIAAWSAGAAGKSPEFTSAVV